MRYDGVPVGFAALSIGRVNSREDTCLDRIVKSYPCRSASRSTRFCSRHRRWKASRGIAGLRSIGQSENGGEYGQGRFFFQESQRCELFLDSARRRTCCCWSFLKWVRMLYRQNHKLLFCCQWLCDGTQRREERGPDGPVSPWVGPTRCARGFGQRAGESSG